MGEAGGRPQRVRVVYHGHVQGVGFRFTALDVARRFDVAGYVRNQPDGSVELDVQGDAAEVEAFLTAVTAQMRPNIRRELRETLPASGGVEGFEIRH